MRSAADRPFSDADKAARKLVEIANGVEPVHDGRIYIERVNAPFLAVGGSGEDFRARIERAIALGWLSRCESGTYLKFTDSGAALFKRQRRYSQSMIELRPGTAGAFEFGASPPKFRSSSTRPTSSRKRGGTSAASRDSKARRRSPISCRIASLCLRSRSKSLIWALRCAPQTS
jgi:hypothetical protein